jgi:hypothetical protein
MPNYEYKCPDGHKYVEARSMTADDTITDSPCKECGKPLIRIFSAPPITFNGTGFSQKRG